MSVDTIKRVYDDDESVMDEYVEIGSDRDGLDCIKIGYFYQNETTDSFIVSKKVAREIAESLLELCK